jgi:hypothetical protein
MDNIQNNSIGVSYIFLYFVFFAAASVGYQIFYSKQQYVDAFDSFIKTMGQYNLYHFPRDDQPLLLEEAKTQDVVAVKEVKFEDKYLDQYAALKNAASLFSGDECLPDDVLEGLSNNFVMEYTPIGNVIMRYDVKRGTFAYYADNVVPFRFLEVLARKYVCTFKCPSLYNSMDDELKRIDELKRSDELKKAEEVDLAKAQSLERQEKSQSNDISDKKSVFVKFKDYNKGSSKESAGVATKPTPSPNPNQLRNPNNKSVAASSGPVGAYVKEHTNRYSCDGKINNMQFLKKVERKVTDKNYTMTFADFKKSTLSTFRKSGAKACEDT